MGSGAEGPRPSGQPTPDPQTPKFSRGSLELSVVSAPVSRLESPLRGCSGVHLLCMSGLDCLFTLLPSYLSFPTEIRFPPTQREPSRPPAPSSDSISLSEVSIGVLPANRPRSPLPIPHNVLTFLLIRDDKLSCCPTGVSYY